MAPIILPKAKWYVRLRFGARNGARYYWAYIRAVFTVFGKLAAKRSIGFTAVVFIVVAVVECNMPLRTCDLSPLETGLIGLGLIVLFLLVLSAVWAPVQMWNDVQARLNVLEQHVKGYQEMLSDDRKKQTRDKLGRFLMEAGNIQAKIKDGHESWEKDKDEWADATYAYVLRHPSLGSADAAMLVRPPPLSAEGWEGATPAQVMAYHAVGERRNRLEALMERFNG